MDRVRRDVRQALRGLARSPLFALTVVATLGLGIGANTAIFSFVDTLLLRPLPYPQSARMAMVWQDFSAAGGPRQEWFTPPDYEDLRTQNRTLEAVSPLVGWNPSLTGVNEPVQLQGAIVSVDYFRVTGVQPAQGRGFSPTDETGDGQVVVLSDALWKRAFGARRDMVGSTIQLNGLTNTVIGIMPRGFEAPFQKADIFRPYLKTTFSTGCGRGCYVMQMLVRVRAGVSLKQAQEDAARTGRALQAQAPGAKKGLVLRLVSLHEQIAGPLRPALVALLGAVGLLLLIACVNIANLLLARATDREREVAVRLAIGASRRIVVHQLLTESLIVAAVGGVAGIVVAFWGVDLLTRMSPPGTARIEEVAVNGHALLFALSVAAVTGILFGLAPAWHLSRVSVANALKESGGLRTGVSRRRTRNTFIAAEVAIALMLLLGAGLMMRSFVRLQAVDAGFHPENALAVQLQLPRARYPEIAQVDAFFDGLLQRLAAQPGVVAAGASSMIPLDGNNSDVDFVVEGRPAPTSREEQPVADYRQITPGYFAAIGMRLLRGRALTDEDRQGTPRVVVINETMAKRFWPNEDALGRRISSSGPDGPWTTVVGIVADAHDRGMDQPTRPEMFLPQHQIPARQLTLVLRTQGDPRALGARIRAEVRTLDKELPIAAESRLTDLVSGSMAMPRLFVAFFGFFAVVALLLASVGIYGVTAQAVSQRRQEIGVRMALGASARGVVALMVGQAMLVVLGGLTVGLVAAWLLSHWLGSLLFDLSPTDPVTFTIIPLLLAAVGLLASWRPARRAAAVDPMRALRTE